MAERVEDLLAEGMAHFRARALSEAKRCWQRVLELEPGNVRAREYLGYVQTLPPTPVIASTPPAPSTTSAPPRQAERSAGANPTPVMSGRPPPVDPPTPRAQPVPTPPRGTLPPPPRAPEVTPTRAAETLAMMPVPSPARGPTPPSALDETLVAQKPPATGWMDPPRTPPGGVVAAPSSSTRPNAMDATLPPAPASSGWDMGESASPWDSTSVAPTAELATGLGAAWPAEMHQPVLPPRLAQEERTPVPGVTPPRPADPPPHVATGPSADWSTALSTMDDANKDGLQALWTQASEQFPASLTPVASPWDDGPTATPTVDLDRAAPPTPRPTRTVSSPTLPITPPALAKSETSRSAAPPNQCDALMSKAREHHALGDFSGSLELVEKVLELDPDNAEARDYLERNEGTLLKMYESKIGTFSRVPRIVMSPDEIIWLNLHHKAGFLLSRVDGMSTFEDILALSSMPRLETCRILAQLVQAGVIRA
ncbi:MAG: hypothetical protein AB2A00_34455 [Myxococcota bacterium]